MKRIMTLMAVSVIALSLVTVTGCGKGEEKAKPDTTNQTQPAQEDKQAGSTNDALAQFPSLKLPYTVKPDAVIAEYKDGTLTAKEFETFLKTITFINPQQRQVIESADAEALKSYARDFTATLILAKRADDATHKESKELAGTTFGKVKEQYLEILGKDEKSFDKLLKTQGLTKEEIVDQMAQINDSINVLKKSVVEADLKKEYEQADKSQFTTASVRHILISTESRKQDEALKLANELIGRIKKGEDFATLAKKYTDDPGSKEEGGLYKDADVSGWVPEFKNAALTQKINEVSAQPVKTNYGYHIIRVEDRKVKTYEEAKELLRQQAVEKKYAEFVSKEMNKLVTKWNIPQPKPAS